MSLKIIKHQVQSCCVFNLDYYKENYLKRSYADKLSIKLVWDEYLRGTRGNQASLTLLQPFPSFLESSVSLLSFKSITTSANLVAFFYDFKTFISG
jgi:hypothetical protein